MTRVRATISFVALALFLKLTLLLASCAPSSAPLTVFAAASLSGVLPEIAAGYSHQVRFHFGGSHTLAHQVSRGFPADILITASPEALKELGGESIAFAENGLVLAASPGWNGVTGLEALREPGLRQLALAQPGAAPLGDYSETELKSLGYVIPAEISYQVDAQATLSAVRHGLCEAGVIYESDLSRQPSLKLLHRFSTRASYRLIQLNPSGECANLATYLTRPEAIKMLESSGFQAPATR